ncbi:MAG TPA: hypothetical protein VFZ08_02590 [Terriglobia bacterium]|nr:hypothetical protein [Terriglobia bacterium]
MFQRKWQGLPHYQRTRGTLAMFAQGISLAWREGFRKARREPLITLGSAPLDVPEFQAVVLGQLGEQRLLPAIEVDIAGDHSRAKALDSDAKGQREGIHRRVGGAILFESTGVATDRPAHLPELRFAIGEPGLDVTSIDNAANALEKRAFFVRTVGTDGFRIGYKPTLKKVVGDRRAALDDAEVIRVIRVAVKQEFDRGNVAPVEAFPADGSDVKDTPKLTVVALDPETEWNTEIRKRLGEWTRRRGASPRLYPAAIVWLVRRPGRSLREKAEMWHAWKRVDEDLRSGVLGTDFDQLERGEVARQIKESEEALKEEVWASFRYAVIADAHGEEGLREIDLGAGHASGSSASLGGRVVEALRTEGLLNNSIGAGYLERNWPVALKEGGAWPLKGCRQAFLDGSLTRLLDPEEVLRIQIVSFVDKGDFALASGSKPDGGYERVWWKEPIRPEEVTFDDKTFLLTRARASALAAQSKSAPTAASVDKGNGVTGTSEGTPTLILEPPAVAPGVSVKPATDENVRICLCGRIPPEQWNKLGQELIPKLRGSGQDLVLSLDASLTIRSQDFTYVEEDLRQALRDLGLDGAVRIERSIGPS